jgi:hypothetical protein
MTSFRPSLIVCAIIFLGCLILPDLTYTQAAVAAGQYRPGVGAQPSAQELLDHFQQQPRRRASTAVGRVARVEDGVGSWGGPEGFEGKDGVVEGVFEAAKTSALILQIDFVENGVYAIVVST